MNKAELIEAVADATDTSKAEASRTLDAVLDSIAGALSNGDSVALVGFGTFNVIERAARMGRNPATGQTMVIPAKKVLKFRKISVFNQDQGSSDQYWLGKSS